MVATHKYKRKRVAARKRETDKNREKKTIRHDYELKCKTIWMVAGGSLHWYWSLCTVVVVFPFFAWQTFKQTVLVVSYDGFVSFFARCCCCCSVCCWFKNNKHQKWTWNNNNCREDKGTHIRVRARTTSHKNTTQKLSRSLNGTNIRTLWNKLCRSVCDDMEKECEPASERATRFWNKYRKDVHRF